MRYLVGATYLVVSSSLLLLLLVEAGGGLALLLRAAVWLSGTAGPLFCAVEFTGDALHARLDGTTASLATLSSSSTSDS